MYNILPLLIVPFLFSNPSSGTDLGAPDYQGVQLEPPLPWRYNSTKSHAVRNAFNPGIRRTDAATSIYMPAQTEDIGNNDQGDGLSPPDAPSPPAPAMAIPVNNDHDQSIQFSEDAASFPAHAEMNLVLEGELKETAPDAASPETASLPALAGTSFASEGGLKEPAHTASTDIVSALAQTDDTLVSEGKPKEAEFTTYPEFDEYGRTMLETLPERMGCLFDDLENIPAEQYIHAYDDPKHCNAQWLEILNDERTIKYIEQELGFGPTEPEVGSILPADAPISDYPYDLVVPEYNLENDEVFFPVQEAKLEGNAAEEPTKNTELVDTALEPGVKAESTIAEQAIYTSDDYPYDLIPPQYNPESEALSPQETNFEIDNAAEEPMKHTEFVATAPESGVKAESATTEQESTKHAEFVDTAPRVEGQTAVTEKVIYTSNDHPYDFIPPQYNPETEALSPQETNFEIESAAEEPTKHTEFVATAPEPGVKAESAISEQESIKHTELVDNAAGSLETGAIEKQVESPNNHNDEFLMPDPYPWMAGEKGPARTEFSTDKWKVGDPDYKMDPEEYAVFLDNSKKEVTATPSRTENPSAGASPWTKTFGFPVIAYDPESTDDYSGWHSTPEEGTGYNPDSIDPIGEFNSYKSEAEARKGVQTEVPTENTSTAKTPTESSTPDMYNNDEGDEIVNESITFDQLDFPYQTVAPPQPKTHTITTSIPIYETEKGVLAEGFDVTVTETQFPEPTELPEPTKLAEPTGAQQKAVELDAEAGRATYLTTHVHPHTDADGSVSTEYEPTTIYIAQSIWESHQQDQGATATKSASKSKGSSTTTAPNTILESLSSNPDVTVVQTLPKSTGTDSTVVQEVVYVTGSGISVTTQVSTIKPTPTSTGARLAEDRSAARRMHRRSAQQASGYLAYIPQDPLFWIGLASAACALFFMAEEILVLIEVAVIALFIMGGTLWGAEHAEELGAWFAATAKLVNGLMKT